MDLYTPRLVLFNHVKKHPFISLFFSCFVTYLFPYALEGGKKGRIIELYKME